MFEKRLEESLGDPRALLHLASDTLIAERAAGCHRLLVASAWADCHGAPAELELVDGEPVQDLCEERFLRLGGVATPLVAEFCPSELGHSLQISLGAARRLVACALTIRHRLPRLWERVKAGEVWAWKAMQIADKTRHLGGLSSWIVDLRVTPHVESMAWPRFLDLLDATLLEVDEASYQRRAEEAAGQRDVRSYRGEHGLRTLVAKVESGDALAFEALVARVAECLADEGDDDPVEVRRSKAVGIIAHQARLRDLLARHADQPHDPRHPEDRVDAHQDDPSDPWAEDDLPPAGWQTDRHGNFHQPSFDDLDDLDDSRASQTPDIDEAGPSNDDEDPVSEADRVWIHLRPMTSAELNASRTRAVVHFHVTDQTLIDQHGVLRTADGPITLDQFRRWLTESDANITVRPVLDPAEVAAIDSYEISTAIREAVQTRHPGSVYPFSPATEVTIGGRLDLDHSIPYQKDGPPGQTRVGNLGPLARSEHRAKTLAGWQVRQTEPGMHLWRSPHGWISVVTSQGTLLLGDGPFAQQVWLTSQPEASRHTVSV